MIEELAKKEVGDLRRQLRNWMIEGVAKREVSDLER